MFIPFALISHQNSDFHQGDELIDSILFERKRIMNYIVDDTFYNDLVSKEIVEKCIEYEEGIV